LTKHAITAAPVPLEKLAQTLGIDVRHTPAEEQLSGFLLRDGESVSVDCSATLIGKWLDATRYFNSTG
jgi:hypothetical protein